MSRSQKISLTIAAAFIAAILYYFQLYRFYSISADHQFLIDKEWILTQIKQPGGTALLISSFATQFFTFPVTGVIVTTIIYMAIALTITCIMRCRDIMATAYPIAFLPVIFMFLSMENSYYGFRGHVALLITIVALFIYEKFIKRTDTAQRAAIATATAALLYFMTGSTTIIFAIYIIMDELMKKRVPLTGIATSAASLAIAYLSVLQSSFISIEEALTPEQYYNWPSSYFFQIYAWASVVLTMPLGLLISKICGNHIRDIIITSLLALAIFATGTRLFSIVHNSNNYQLHHEEYLAQHEDWDSIIELHKGSKQPVYFISYLNLALAQKGVLVESMSRYNQMDVSEKLGWQPTSKEGLQLKSTVFYHLGFLSAARQATFELNIMTPGSANPEALVRLASISKAMNYSTLADKYLYIVHKALLYSDAQPQAIETRTPNDNRFMGIDGFEKDLEDIVEANPDNDIAIQFLKAYRVVCNKYRNI